MKILHTADLHLGKSLHEQNLIIDQKSILNEIVQILEKDRYDLLIVAGDVFDRSVASVEAIELWDDFLYRVTTAAPSLTVVAISGNHDSAGRLAFASRFMVDRNVHIRTDVAQVTQPISLEGPDATYDIYAVPFLFASSLEESSLRTQRELWESTLDKLNASKRKDRVNIMVAHLFCTGGIESESERLFLGEAEQIPASWFEDWDYVALGHLHKPQKIGERVWYSGSPLAYSFSEAEVPKVVLSVDLVPQKCNVERIALTPLRKLLRWTSTFDDFMTSPFWENEKESYLELTLTDSILVPQPVQKLRTRFPYLLSLLQNVSETSSSNSNIQFVQTGHLLTDALNFLNAIDLNPTQDQQEYLKAKAKETMLETP